MIKCLRSISLLMVVFSCLAITSANQAEACEGHDVIITNITITSITTESAHYVYAYTYEIKNIGTAAIALNQIVLQNYISPDDIYGQNDIGGGGMHLASSSSTEVLAAGATYSGSDVMSVGKNYPPDSYAYFFTDIYLDSETECDINNNQYSGMIEVTATGNQSAHKATAHINWNTDTKSFSVKDWSGNNTAALQYTVFSTSGSLLFSGSISEGQVTSLASIQSGVYIIYLSDGENFYSNKIIY